MPLYSLLTLGVVRPPGALVLFNANVAQPISSLHLTVKLLFYPCVRWWQES